MARQQGHEGVGMPLHKTRRTHKDAGVVHGLLRDQCHIDLKLVCKGHEVHLAEGGALTIADAAAARRLASGATAKRLGRLGRHSHGAPLTLNAFMFLHGPVLLAVGKVELHQAKIGACLVLVEIWWRREGEEWKQ